MKTKSGNVVPEVKLKVVDELANLIKTKKTILIASIKNLPASQFQEISKKIRGKAIVKVPRRNLILKAIDNSKNKEVEKLKEKIEDSIALLFSDIDGFELAGQLIRNKQPAAAKPGQEAPIDIEIKAGMTELVPGPAISELGAVGLVVKVTKGKLEITKDKIIVKQGVAISVAASDVMAKLGIKPFSIGFIPVCAFDLVEGKLYTDIKIDRDETIENLKSAHGKALPFAVDLGYHSKDTIKFLIGKASVHGNKINRIMTGEPEPVVTVEAPKEEEKVEETKPEEKKEATAAGLGALFG